MVFRASNCPLERSIVNEHSPGESTIIESPLRSFRFGSCWGSRNRPSISCGRETRETRSAGGSSQRVFPSRSIASNLEILLLDVGLFTERTPQRAIRSLFHDGNISCSSTWGSSQRELLNARFAVLFTTEISSAPRRGALHREDSPTHDLQSPLRHLGSLTRSCLSELSTNYGGTPRVVTRCHM